jgi:hypothetical protein
MSDFVELAVKALIAARLATENRVEGCSEAEVASIERTFGLTLPRAYRAFLLRMGKAAGEFWTGTNYQFPELLELRETAEALLIEGGARWQLGAPDFVFAVHQGYQFLFFRTGTSDDPEVFHYLEGDEGARSVAPSFSAWLAGCVDDEIAAARAV